MRYHQTSQKESITTTKSIDVKGGDIIKGNRDVKDSTKPIDSAVTISWTVGIDGQ